MSGANPVGIRPKLLAIGCAWLTCVCCQRPAPPPGESKEGGPVIASRPEAATLVADGLPDFSGLFERASPAVVNISAAHALPIPEDLLPRRQQAIWRALARSLGSGFAIDDRGHVVTCSSVIQDAEEIEVILANGRQLRATVVGSDEVTDIAVLSVPPEDAPRPLPVAEPRTLRAGDWVAAFGYPFGLSHSITAGIVSAVCSPEALPSSNGLILSDAAINPGCNGGPLLDSDGRVVGINLISSRSDSSLGLAIPIHDALPVIRLLKQGKQPRHAWLGLSVQVVDASLALSFGLERAEGALVSRVLRGGPADQAGICAGDIIVAFAGQPVEDPQALIETVRQAPIGRPAKLRIIRKGTPKTLAIVPRTEP